MADSDTEFEGSIPALYDAYLGPVIFEPYAVDIAQRCAEPEAAELLETAAGTGVVTRMLDRLLPVSTTIVATDLKAAMLSYAATRSDPSSARVSWQEANAQSLPFDDKRFDVVVCQFGAMFFPNKAAAYQEALRVLKPGGRFVFSVWDRIEANEFADVTSAAVASCFPYDPPDFLARVPHGYHDIRRILNELGAAGFSRVAVETIERRSQADSPSHPAIGYCQGTPLRVEVEARDPGRLVEVTETATAAISARFGSGTVDARTRAHVITATR